MSETPKTPIRCFEGSAEPYQPFWKMVDAAESASGEPEINFDGYISEYSWWMDDITPEKFKNDLYKLGQKGAVTIRMNSYGGDVIAASKMYSIIKEYPGRVTVLVDSIAASAATVVAMAGDKVLINSTGFFMIHDPSFIFFIAQLNIETMERMLQSLLAVKEGIINAYEAKSGLSRARLANLMTGETWMDAQRAVDLGFVDEIYQPAPKSFELQADNAALVNAVQALNYSNLPAALQAVLAAQPELGQLRSEPQPVVSSETPVEDEHQRQAQCLSDTEGLRNTEGLSETQLSAEAVELQGRIKKVLRKKEITNA